MEKYDEEEYYPALEACYSLLTDESYLNAMKFLFNQPENKWLNVKKEWFDVQEPEFYKLFENELSVFNITLEEFEDFSVMWSIPPNKEHGGIYLIIFFNAINFNITSGLYNYEFLVQR
ncbi:hypothetical protein [Acinetobacter seifertii]|uniref:hypothetical protein n=1 Tax=Acinetobacter seifertii TaxID=1530123 RepID=UPI00124DE8BB|nr:hypothetical protein [Acinetobacter seifertii]